jgi:hypothetical protein
MNLASGNKSAEQTKCLREQNFYSVAGTAEKRREEEREGEFLPDSQGQNKNQFPHPVSIFF